MLPRRLILPPLLLLVALLVAACDEADRDYMEGFCDASVDFSSSLARATGEAEIVAAVEAHREAVAALTPADDLDDYHQDYLDYLDSIVADPAGDAGEPPDPPAAARLRAESAAGGIPSCQETGYFQP